jgi:colanic acid/amylovoran biosynthesis glycosyltransferase
VKFGYLVPEFPGQTHTFFWRELTALRGFGMEPDLISTRRPNSGIMSQDWAPEAEEATTYLAPLTFKAAVGAVRVIAQGAASGRLMEIVNDLKQDMRLVAKLEGAGAASKRALRQVGLLLIAAELSHVAALRGWSHIHVHSCADSAQIALFAHQLGGLTYSLTLHGSLGDYGPNQSRKWRHSEFSTVITHQLLQEVSAAVGTAAAARAEVVPMGVDTSRFSRQSPYVPWDGTGTARIFTCGRLNGSKGHDDLLRAVRELSAQGLDVELSIAGEDEEGGTGYRRYLEGLILKLGLTNRITILGAVAEEDVRAQLERAHVFALASHAEPLGVAIMEAMSMELPVVVTGAGGVTELVENDRSGILVPPRAPSVLATQILKVLYDPELAISLGQAARRQVNSSFTSKQGAAALSRMILSKTSEPGSRGVESFR